MAGAIVEISAVTTTVRSHVPLWPLYICAGLFAAGLTLFINRDRSSGKASRQVPADSKQRPVSTHIAPPSPPKHEFVNATYPAELTDLMHGRYQKQEKLLQEAFYGKWFRVSGPIAAIHEWRNNSQSAYVTLKLIPINPSVSFYFNDRAEFERRTALLEPGTMVTIIGRISRLDSSSIALSQCEFEKIANR